MSTSPAHERYRRTGPPSLDTSRPKTANEYVRTFLRHRILTGDLPGGTRLVQSDLAEELEVSTTPVREALRDLASEGLIRLDPHRGAFVNELSVADVREVYEIRKVLEPMVLRLAIPKLTEADLRRLEELCNAMESDTSTVQWVELNRQFHGVFMDASGWPRLASIVRSLHDAACPYVALAMRFRHELIEGGNKDHRSIFEAARAGDVEQAVACVVEHMDITKLAIEERAPDGS